MEQLTDDITQLKNQVAEALEKLDIAKKYQLVGQLEKDMSAPDFWNDQDVARQKSKQQAKLKQQTEPWIKLQADIAELEELAAMEDDSLKDDLSARMGQATARFSALKKQLMFNGPYDTHDVIMRLYAGAGGTDAQDWAEMLQRMYVRWAESEADNVVIIEQSSGDEAGIKSATIAIDGSYMYGRLRGEHGVHRLVRQSPFNSDSLRQTSFAMVEVMPKIDEPTEVAIDDKELKIDVYRSGGKGGQSVNTTDSAVRVTHIPTNISVAIQNERSQIQNKETAMTILRSKLAQLQQAQHAEKIDEIKGPSTSVEWGSQIRNYVLHPYKQVKDVRTKHESSDPERILDGDINEFVDAYLEYSIGKE